MAMESKKEIYDLIPAKFIPKTILIKKGTNAQDILQMAENAGIGFPLIAKPDIGMKALGVDKINGARELEVYKQKIAADFLIQELIEYPNEIGIFYVRFPDKPHGEITGLVGKEFLSVTGNGKETIVELIKQNPRSFFQLKALKRMYGNFLSTVLAPGEKFILVPYGSHTRGSKFIDISGQMNDTLSDTIHQICSQIPGFFYGRLDVRYASFDELSKGKNFSIIELNGAGSEPTFIYDPRHSIFFAWKQIIKHWKLLYQISVFNFAKGHQYLSFKDGKAMLRANSLLEAKLKLF